MEQKNLEPLQPGRQEEEHSYEEFITPRPDEINPNRLTPDEPQRPYQPQIEPEQEPIHPLQPNEPLQPERSQPYGPSEPGQQPAHGFRIGKP